MSIRLQHGQIAFGLSLVSMALYVLLQVHTAWNPIIRGPLTHMYIVSIAAFMTLLISVFIGLMAYHLQNIQLLCLSLGFISMTALFASRGLSTHVLMVNSNLFSEVTAELGVTMLGIWLWISSLPSDSRLMQFLGRHHTLLIPGLLLFLLTLNVLLLSISSPSFMSALVNNRAKYGVATVSCVFFMMAGSRYYQSYRYSRLPLQRVMVASTFYMCVVQVIMSTSAVWSVTWWAYHAILFLSIGIIIIGIAQQYMSDTSLGTAIRGMFSANPVERTEAGIGSKVRTLVIATEGRDKYTAGHNFRVATYAVLLGQEMGIFPEQLRALAQGGSVHDVGKIQIPDAVLNKPGLLTDEERRAMEQHPVAGYEVCKRLGFMADELAVVRHHHERFDGHGYPDKLSGERIPLLARITAVADVYDALTSSRSYREAMGHDEAMRIIASGSGTQFDPACVVAWHQVNLRELSISSMPAWLVPHRSQRAILYLGESNGVGRQICKDRYRRPQSVHLYKQGGHLSSSKSSSLFDCNLDLRKWS